MIGQSMTLSGESYEVIGVAGQLQNGPIVERSTLSADIEINDPSDVYLPFQIDPDSAAHGHFFNVAGTHHNRCAGLHNFDLLPIGASNSCQQDIAAMGRIACLDMLEIVCNSRKE